MLALKKQNKEREKHVETLEVMNHPGETCTARDVPWLKSKVVSKF